MANGAPTVSNGLVISGVTTVTTLDLNGDLDVDGHLNADNVSIAGVVTATSFVGSGANLTSLPAANLTGTLPAISGANLTSLPAQATVNNNADNRVITGGSGVNLYAESGFTYDGTTVQIPDRINCNTNGTYLKENQLSFNPTGTAYIDHYRTGQDIQIRMSTSSSLDTTGPTFKSNGNLAFASGKGIDFSNAGGSNAGSSSATLDDYEEGSFTAILRSNSNPANTNYTYDTSSNFTSYYTKIGNIVYVSISLSNLHTSPDLRNHQLIRVEGLPFTTARRCGINVVDGRGIYPRWASDSQTTNAATWTPWADGNSTMFYLQLYMHFTPYTAWATVANSTSSQRLHLAGCYPVA